MKPIHNAVEPLMNEHEVAQVLGCSLATLRRWRLLGTGPRFRKIGALCRYSKSDLQDWLVSRPTGGSLGDLM